MCYWELVIGRHDSSAASPYVCNQGVIHYIKPVVGCLCFLVRYKISCTITDVQSWYQLYLVTMVCITAKLGKVNLLT